MRRGAFRWPRRLRSSSKLQYSVTSEPSAGRHGNEDDTNNNSSALLDFNKYKISSEHLDGVAKPYEERAVDVGDDVTSLSDANKNRACVILPFKLFFRPKF